MTLGEGAAGEEIGESAGEVDESAEAEAGFKGLSAVAGVSSTDVGFAGSSLEEVCGAG